MKIADELKDEGLLLLGFDFIGDQLSELNFTSPTGLVQMNAFTKRANEKTIVDELAKF
jgi:glutathione synthase